MMKHNTGSMAEAEDQFISKGSRMRSSEDHKHCYNRDVIPRSDLWTNGLICAFEFVRCRRKTTRPIRFTNIHDTPQLSTVNKNHVPTNGVQSASSQKHEMGHASLIQFGEDQVAPFDDHIGGHVHQLDHVQPMQDFSGSHWVPIGWVRISELVQKVQVDAGWSSQQVEVIEDDNNRTAADLAAPYWERPAGPIWWCHVAAGNQFINEWLSNAQWLHPAISIALRDESRLISEKMKHLFYEVPVRVAGGLLFELLGQSAGDPFVDEDDIPIVLRSWQAQNFLITSMHVKGSTSNINVLGINEVQELLYAGGDSAPKNVHEIVALLASRLARWDDRLFRKSIFGVADEVELKFMNRRNHEDMNLFSVIMNQEIRKLSMQVIRVKWSLHAREEIVFELLQHLRGTGAKNLLESIKKSTREMIEEQEAVRGRLFTIQDVMQGTVRSWLQDRSLRVTHNLTVFGGCGLVLSIITGLFGINVDGIPGAASTPYAFGLFTTILVFLGAVLIAIGLLYLGLKKPITEEQVEVRKYELQQLVKMFQHEAETHAQVRKHVLRNNIPPTAADLLLNDTDYVLIV